MVIEVTVLRLVAECNLDHLVAYVNYSPTA